MSKAQNLIIRMIAINESMAPKKVAPPVVESAMAADIDPVTLDVIPTTAEPVLEPEVPEVPECMDMHK